MGDKFHITCEGDLEIKDGVAHITVKRTDNPWKRHILKTISYRLLGTGMTVLLALLLGFSLQTSSLIGVGELVLKPLLYFIHERIWFKFGKTGR